MYWMKTRMAKVIVAISVLEITFFIPFSGCGSICAGANQVRREVERTEGRRVVRDHVGKEI
jgi:hypothetical protein